MKEEVLETLEFDHFTAKELASEVRKSGLYDANKIIERMEQLEEQARTENEQLKNDMKTVKSKLNTEVVRMLGCYHGYYGNCDCIFNPWERYVGKDVKSRYGHL